MARLRAVVVALDSEGDVWAGATVKFYQPGTASASGASTSGTPFAGNLYAAVSGGSTISTTQTADARGTVVVFTDTASRFDVGIEPGGGVAARVRAYESLEFDPADVVTDDTLTAAIKLGPVADLLAIGTTVSTGEKGIELSHASNSSGGAITLTSKNATTTYPLHFNIVEAGADPTGKPVLIGARLPGYNTSTAIQYAAAVLYNNDEINWGGLLVDGETTDASGSSESTGGDVNVLKVVATARTAGSWVRNRAVEIYAVKGDGSTSMNISPMRGIDANVVIASNLSAGTKPWHYNGVAAMSRNYSFTARQANAAYYAGGTVGAGTPGWSHGFYHDLADVDPGGSPDPAFYSDANGYIFAKLRLGIGIAPTEVIQAQGKTAGTAAQGLLQHTQNSNGGSHALWWAQAGGASGGDAYFRATISGATEWSTGIDNSDSDAWVLSPAASLGGTNYFKATTAGVVSFGPTLNVTANATGLGVGVAPTEAIHVVGATAGTPTVMLVRQTDNTNASSHASAWYRTGGASGGSPYMRFTIDTVLDWSIGAQNDAGDAFKITKSSSPGAGGGSSDYLTLDTSGNVIIGNAALATNATNGFFYAPSSAGSPSGVPTAYTGRVPIEIDTTNGRLYAYYGAAWHYVALT